MRRWFSLCSVLALIFLFSGCDDNSTAKKLSEAHSSAEQLQAQIDELKGKIDDLQNEVDRFDDNNWKDVVPAIRDKVSDIQGDSEGISAAILELTSELDALASEANDGSDY